jgi:hypothetical protein
MHIRVGLALNRHHFQIVQWGTTRGTGQLVLNRTAQLKRRAGATVTTGCDFSAQSRSSDCFVTNIAFAAANSTAGLGISSLAR